MTKSFIVTGCSCCGEPAAPCSCPSGLSSSYKIAPGADETFLNSLPITFALDWADIKDISGIAPFNGVFKVHPDNPCAWIPFPGTIENRGAFYLKKDGKYATIVTGASSRMTLLNEHTDTLPDNPCHWELTLQLSGISGTNPPFGVLRALRGTGYSPLGTDWVFDCCGAINSGFADLIDVVEV